MYWKDYNLFLNIFIISNFFWNLYCLSKRDWPIALLIIASGFILKYFEVLIWADLSLLKQIQQVYTEMKLLRIKNLTNVFTLSWENEKIILGLGESIICLFSKEG